MLARPTAASRAIVLRTWPTGETSVLASLLTEDHGYVKVIAKGARGERSVLRPLVQPGCLVDVEFSLRPDRELQYLKAGQILDDPGRTAPDLERTAYLLAALDLVDRCRPGGDRDLGLFDLCRRFLQVLSSATSGSGTSRFYAFEMSLLDLHGMAPVLDHCAHCGEPALDDGRGLRFDAASGGLVCRRCVAGGVGVAGRPLGLRSLEAMRRMAGDTLDAEPEIDGDRARRREVGIHLHRFMNYHVPMYRLPAALELLRRRRTPDPRVGDRESDER